MNITHFTNGNFLKYDFTNDTFYIFNGHMVVKDGIIVDFYTGQVNNDSLNNINLNGKLIIPSLKNCHIHLGETIFSPLKGKWSLKSYLEYTEYYNNLLGDLKEAYWLYSAVETINECISNGISNICTARGSNVLCNTNLKCLCGYPIMLTSKLKHYTHAGIEGFNKFVSTLSANIVPGVFLHSLYTNNESSLRLAKECFETSQFITIHVSETEDTENQVKKMWNGLSSIEILNINKLLHPNTILVHGGLLNDKELSLIAKNNSSLIICPISNKKLKTICINPKVLEKYNIRWALGTDGLATGITANLFEHTKVLKRTFNVEPEEALKSITFYASDILNYKANKYLDIGYEADFIVLDTNSTSINASIHKILDDITDNNYKILKLYINGSLQHTIKNSNISINFNNKSEIDWK